VHDVAGAAVVTGGAGFIGAHLAGALARRGVPVRATDRRPQPESLRRAGVAWVPMELEDVGRLPALLAGSDVLYHLASAHLQVNAPEAEFRRVNVDAAVALVRACAAAGVRRMVHASTVGIYGHVAAPPAAEDAPRAPGNVYERTKLEGEEAVLAAAREVGLDVVVLRPAWVYGPDCPRTGKLLRAVRSGRFFYVGSGRNLRHPIHVADAVAAFERAAVAPAGCAGRSYNIAGPRAVELRELVALCARLQGVRPPRLRVPRAAMLALGRAAELAWGVAGREPPFSRRSLVFFENDNAFDITAARQELGFEPVVDLEEGLRRTVAEMNG
jgi:dihydroflavonol-4-reductase